MRFKDKVWNILNTVLYVLFVISALTSTIGILLLIWGDDGAVQLAGSGLLLLFVSGLWLAVNQAIETKHWIKTHCRKEG